MSLLVLLQSASFYISCFLILLPMGAISRYLLSTLPEFKWNNLNDPSKPPLFQGQSNQILNL